MDFTFAIMTDGQNDSMVTQIVESIYAEKMPTYEILILGDSHLTLDHTRVICNSATEAQQNGRAWITKKKNIATNEARYENIVFIHDYIKLERGWYAGWEKFDQLNPDWQVATNYIYTLEGGRHSDWVLSPYDMWYFFPELNNTWNLLLPPDEESLTRFMYISGGYWVAKKFFALQNPQLEQYGWGESEDVKWSETVRTKTRFYFNPNSSAKLLKPGKWQPGSMPLQYISFLKRIAVWLEKQNG